LATFDYFGNAFGKNTGDHDDHYANKMSRHKNKYKFDLSKEDVFRMLLGSKLAIDRMGAVAILLRRFSSIFMLLLIG
jgi:hypothetical protein